MSRLSKLYLFAYNSFQTIGWTISFFRIILGFISAESFNVAFSSAGDLVSLLQRIAFLEVIHGALGLVPSGMLLPLMQWGGRTHYLLAIVGKIDEVQASPSIFLTFFCWSISEAIRYSHYALNCIGSCPYWVMYLRYTAFILLYPMGVFGEMWLMYQALPIIKERKLYADAFAYLPFNYYHFVQAVLLLYPVLWFRLYAHLFKQRRSRLGKQDKKKK